MREIIEEWFQEDAIDKTTHHVSVMAYPFRHSESICCQSIVGVHDRMSEIVHRYEDSSRSCMFGT